MNSPTAQVDDIRLVALSSALSCTELFVHFTLNEWSLSIMREETVDTARQLVEPVIDSTDSRAPGFMTVRLRVAGDCVVVEVEDDQRHLAHAPAPEVPGKRTGSVPFDGRGKRVWCEVPLPAGLTAGSVRLPQRGERRSPLPDEAFRPQEHPQASPQSNALDPALVDRVLVGLKRHEW